MRAELGALLVTALAVAGCSTAAPATPPPTVTSSSTPAAAAGPQPLPTAAEVRPVHLRIPAIAIDAPALVPLGLGPDHQLEAPAKFEDVGWYADGPVPGDPGPAVIAAHVDSRAGPAPFFRLRELKGGDEVFVTRSDGQETRFVVDRVQRYPKNAFPTDAVYGPAPGSALRLITCGGSFDAAKRSYRDNIVVYASTRWG
ncbi:class F sortase [Amycolatopsis sp., V23-08]|uniref:Class F sortase n=1 Tax=Amycolatopsis heterodermiae TaxID=3110235 RepID=A0ABU5R5G3_9PSEU|nr:class F sortase [Amycolatopsis sp., V23-08]MEA5361453.1 class F sortase [Amycolatopsis sp., V23-08]